MALNIGNPIFDRKNYGKSTRTEANVPASKVAKADGGKMYTIGDLKPGLEFKATVSDVNNNTIRLRLSDGQQISARLDANADFNIGEEITFTVKANDGTQIDISPQKIAQEVNPTLLKALGAADLPATDTNLEMVKSMMTEQLPIDKSSLQSMHRMILNNPGAPIDNLVQMTKFNIPVTPSNLTQFENYKNFENQISKELSALSSELTENLEGLSFAKFSDLALDPKEILDGGNNASQVLTEGMTSDKGIEQMLTDLGIEASPEELEMLKSLQVTGDAGTVTAALKQIAEGGTPEALEYNDMLIEIALEEDAPAAESVDNSQAEASPQAAVQADPSLQAAGEGEVPPQPEGKEALRGAAENEGARIPKEAVNNADPSKVSEEQGKEAVKEAIKNDPEAVLKDPVKTPDTLAKELSLPERNELANTLKQAGMPEKLAEAVREGNITDKEFLKGIKDQFDGDKGSLKQLLDQAVLSNKVYKKVLSGAISKQWFLKPSEVGEEQKVSNLYEKLNRQMKMVAEQTAGLSSNSGKNIMQLATNTSGNMDFMNHVNQSYAYVQIPVHINGEDKQSDLYVFSNKKNMSDKEGEIKALLHLDMDALGAVDAFMKLQDTKLDTKFTLDNDESYKLFEDHITELTARLEAKGYNCKITFDTGSEKVDFVEDFLKQGQSVGVPQRFAFDIRA